MLDLDFPIPKRYGLHQVRISAPFEVPSEEVLLFNFFPLPLSNDRWLVDSVSTDAFQLHRCPDSHPLLRPCSPHNWVSNTVVCAVGIGIVSYGIWTYSADKEVSIVVASAMLDSFFILNQFFLESNLQWRHNPPSKPIPSMRVSIL